ncbi:MAG: hypothetical protein GX382_14510 [Syntrophomonadaceae bacterium]|jgi:hypothetical protein|nr:hypothetical protein [Syntrophomonadaceae bacterium]
MSINKYQLTPSVDPTQEFVEIAYDFSNPLDIVREGLSNAFDAGATKIEILFSVIKQYGEKVLITTIKDNGHGMNRDGLQAFFDLGNSTRRGDDSKIGEKGHGTKVYLNSSLIEVETINDGIRYYAVMDKPIKKLHDHTIPDISVTEERSSEETGTKITITGYNNNRRDRFTHECLKDYILWFTKMGSIEKEFNITTNQDVVLTLKGVDRKEPEVIKFGHVFPNNSKSVALLFDEYLAEAPKWFCKKIVKSGNLENFPEIRYDAVFCIEGTRVKYSYNPMIRRSGYSAPSGAYTIQERYGLWLCKDYIPIQKKNEWITQKGSEYTRFHAFINCQDLRLTANRGSIDNTPSEIIDDLRKAATSIYEDIIQGDDWRNLDWLENEAVSYNTIQKEKKDFNWRLNRLKSTRVADYKGVRLVEPTQESGVFAMFMQLKAIDPNMFPFTVIDYDTHVGIDVIVKANDSIPIKTSKLYYVEFKNYLKKEFNHSFENLHSIICWDIDTRITKNGDEVSDIAQEKRTLKIIPPAKEGDYTRFFLDAVRSDRKIEVIVLKQYLEETAGIKFRPRTEYDYI